MSDSEVQPVFELGLKIRGLMDWARNSRKFELASFRALDNRANVISYSTLQSCLKNERISVQNQEALAEAFGFRSDWREWRDTEALSNVDAGKRRDRASAFLSRFIEHRSSAAILTIEPGRTTHRVDRRFADFAFALAGSFESNSGSNEFPLVLSLSFDRRGWPVFLDLTVGIKEVDLQLFYDRSAGSIDAFPITGDGGPESNFGGNVEGLSPWWVISVVHGDVDYLSGVRRQNDGKDCLCVGFHQGDEIRAVMTARVSDCFVKVAGEAFEGIGAAKSRFIEHLVKLAVLDPDDTQAVLGEQILTVVEKS